MTEERVTWDGVFEVALIYSLDTTTLGELYRTHAEPMTAWRVVLRELRSGRRQRPAFAAGGPRGWSARGAPPVL